MKSKPTRRHLTCNCISLSSNVGSTSKRTVVLEVNSRSFQAGAHRPRHHQSFYCWIHPP